MDEIKMERQIATVSVASVEVLVAHYVRIIKWLVIALVISLFLMFGSFAIPYIVPAEVVESQDFAADASGDGTYLIGGGDVSYGGEGASSQN